MEYSDIAGYVHLCEEAEQQCGEPQIRWCDERRFRDENANEVSPGGSLNPYGYYVIGTTIGGNAIIISDEDPRVCFADHSWYNWDTEINYQNLAGDRQWISLPYTLENVRRSLFPLAENREVFLPRLSSGEIGKIIADID